VSAADARIWNPVPVVVLVWVSGWQMQCCGEPFAVGDEIEWTLDDGLDVEWLEAALGADLAHRIGYAEEHHGRLPEGSPVTSGTVLGIKTAHGRFAPAIPDVDGTLYPVPGSEVLAEVDRVDGSESGAQGLHMNGYVVELEVAHTL
jgi:hypothetical protein